MLYRAKRKRKGWTWSSKVLAVLISMPSWELPIVSTAALRVSKAWLSRSRSPITRRKSQTRAHPWKTRNCKDKPLSAVRRTRLSSMLRWPKKWSDKNSHSTLAPHHTAQKLSQSKIHYLLESQWVKLPIRMVLALGLMLCNASVNSSNSNSKANRESRTPPRSRI